MHLFKPSLLLVALIFSGCSSTMDRANQIEAGMTKAELLKVAGAPITSMSPGNGVEILRYEFKKQRLYRLAVPLRMEYIVRLENGHVTAYGTPRDLAKSAPATPLLDPRERIINVNIKTSGETNSLSPIQPRLEIPTH